MLGDHADNKFDQQWDHQYLRSVYAATSAAFERTAGGTPEMAYVALAVELRERGIEPERDVLFSAAMLISQGRQPAILRPGTGRRKRTDITRI